MAKFGKSSGGSKSKKDNKGPKGKKARAKAKLEKQWGETVVYDHGRETTRRHQQRGSRRPNADRQQNQSTYDTDNAMAGSSLAKSSLEKTYNRRNDGKVGHDNDRYNKSQNTNEDDDDDDDDDAEQEDNPLNGLLSIIRKTKKRSKKETSMTNSSLLGNGEDEDDDELGPSHVGNDSMSDDDDDDDDSVSDSDDDNDTDVSDSDDDDDDVGIMMTEDGRTKNGQKDGHNGKKIVDIFRQRFSHQPLPSSVADDDNSPAVPTTTKKIVLDRHSSSDVVELNVSIPQYRDIQVTGSGNRRGTSNSISTSKTVLEQDKSSPNTPITEELLQDLPNVDWQDVAMSTFQSTNRSILRRRWMKQIGFRKDTQPSSIMPNGGTTGSRTNNTEEEQVDDVHASVYSFLARYADMFVTTTSPSMSPNRQLKEQRSFHQMYLLHVLNHVLTSRGRITRNNRELKEKEEEVDDDAGENGENLDDKEDKETNNNHDEDPDRYRDQGFTRPTVLVLLPTRGTCHKFVKDLYRLTGSSWNEDIKERFETEYGPVNDEMDEDGGGDNDNQNTEKEQRRKAVLEKKGKEWNELFGDNANNDDDFKLGISLTPKVAKISSPKNSSNVAVRVYTDFFKSDIVVTSPLGLKMLILPDETGNGDDDDDQDGGREAGKKNSTNFDFLSSIEICLIEHAETILMQNWDHVNDVLDYLNQEPQSNNNADFSRVRSYLLNGQGQYWRQLILSSKFVDPTLNSFFKRFGKSLSGSVKVRRKISNEDAAVSNVLVPIKQVFQKVKSPSLAQQGQARVDFFVENILPQIERQKQTHTLVYIPSYFDFCAARNALLKRDISFVSITEYSRTSEVGRGRARFLQGRKPLMLYTGRAHFFHRHSIRGVKHLIFLGVPEHGEFYSDHVNMIGSILGDSKRAVVEGDEMAIIETSSCLALFTKYEAHALERVVGSRNCTRMIGGTKSTFMFYT